MAPPIAFKFTLQPNTPGNVNNVALKLLENDHIGVFYYLKID